MLSDCNAAGGFTTWRVFSSRLVDHWVDLNDLRNPFTLRMDALCLLGVVLAPTKKPYMSNVQSRGTIQQPRGEEFFCQVDHPVSKHPKKCFKRREDS